jgi:hypothetical protein
MLPSDIIGIDIQAVIDKIGECDAQIRRYQTIRDDLSNRLDFLQTMTASIMQETAVPDDSVPVEFVQAAQRYRDTVQQAKDAQAAGLDGTKIEVLPE